MTEYLFVYGTLLPGRGPSHLQELLKRLRPLGPATVPGLLYDLGEYPGAILNLRSASKVLGHVFELPADQDLLPNLDDYEGFDATIPASSLFLRSTCAAMLSEGRSLLCWVYIYNRDPGDATRILTGDYAKHRALH